MIITESSREFKYLHISGAEQEIEALKRLVMQSRHIHISEATTNKINVVCMTDEIFCSLMKLFNNKVME